MNASLLIMEYPCTREDLMRETARGVAEVVGQLALLEDRRYQGARDVLTASVALDVAEPMS